MRRLVLLIGIAFGLGSSGPTIARSSAPILVELFTSEGCSSCPPADSLLQQLIETSPVAGTEVIGLGEHVDYWDRLGWRDRFSSADFSERQQRYASALKVPSPYTPQMIVDGRSEFVGSDVKAARLAIERAAVLPRGVVAIAAEPSPTNHVAVAVKATELPALSRGDHADIMLAIIQNGLQSNVRAGENKGRALTHAAVVRRLSTIGEAKGDAKAVRAEVKLEPDWQRDHVRLVAFVQERASRHVLAAAVAPLLGARP